MNLDSAGAGMNGGLGGGLGGGGGMDTMKIPSKPFLDDLMNAKDKKSVRPPSPVNKRVGFAEVS